MYKAKQNFSVPNRPDFREGAVYMIDSNLAGQLVRRGLVEPIKEKETKKKKKSNSDKE